ncbi:hypothetical protein [uncultured Fretibacterium sp.]|uniref:hypothetical protein n=1 Tax=uncultured Fretibacterium sp. TaxID=1678694 RepID=UPI0026131F27|nr:hypothetical protein [uncultured Fretibacterium sp.]
MAAPNDRGGEGFCWERGRSRRLWCVLACLAAVLSISPRALGDAPAEQVANPFGETIRVLEQWTVSHWGRDCFVWIVYYPKELIEPWVEAEALRVGMSEAERRAYRDTFVSELRMDEAEPFLVSVYSFGARPVSLAPVSDNILLVTAAGERVRPVRYDTNLDQPLRGLVQGLVFFPKQRNTDFAVAVKGMGGYDERLFSFAPAASLGGWDGEADPSPEETRTVVVELPKKPAPKRVSVRPVQPPKPAEHPAVPMAPPPSAPRPIPPLLAEDSGDMALFVESVRDRGASLDRGEADRTDKKESASPETLEAPEKPEKNAQSAYVSREQVLRRFLTLWADNRPDEMYAMLSAESRRMLSPENFAREAAKASDFRAGLKDGYRIDWVGEERARVITDRRFLMFRSLVVRTLGVTREGSSWKIVW